MYQKFAENVNYITKPYRVIYDFSTPLIQSMACAYEHSENYFRIWIQFIGTVLFTGLPLFHFLTEICACFSFLETGAIELKLRHSLQNGLYLWSIILFVIWPKVTKLLLFKITLNTAARQSALLLHAVSAVTAVACHGPADTDTWEW